MSFKGALPLMPAMRKHSTAVCKQEPSRTERIHCARATTVRAILLHSVQKWRMRAAPLTLGSHPTA